MENTNQEDFVFDDAFFMEYANEIKEQQSQRGGSNFSREYEEVGYAACKPGENRIFRMIGLPPKDKAHARRPWDPKDVIMSDIKSDDGKRFTLRLPPREDVAAKNHIIHRLYDRINEVTWINKTKVFVNAAKHPELIEKSNKMGFVPEDGDITYKSASGLKGSKFIIQNVIDRHDNWCEENKHTKVLANQVNVVQGKDGKEMVFPKPGIKEFGYLDKLADLMTKYGLPEGYDIAIKRVAGAKTNPWELRNASVYKDKDLMDELRNDDGSVPKKDIIFVGPLSQEEKDYEKYDLDKFYGATTYQTILKRIPSIFKETDAAFKSKLYDELQSLAKEEKEYFDKIYRDEEKETSAKEVETTKEIVKESTTEAPPKRRASIGPVETGLSADKIAALKGWYLLSEEQRTLIKDVIFNGDNSIKDIKWLECEDTSELLACECQIASPSSFSHCPACGASFIEG